MHLLRKTYRVLARGKLRGKDGRFYRAGEAVGKERVAELLHAWREGAGGGGGEGKNEAGLAFESCAVLDAGRPDAQQGSGAVHNSII